MPFCFGQASERRARAPSMEPGSSVSGPENASRCFPVICSRTGVYCRCTSGCWELRCASCSMKILLVDQFSGAAGGQQCLIDLVPGLVGRGWSVHAAIPSGGTLGQRLSELSVSVREFPPLDYGNGRKTARDVFRFPVDTLHLARMIRQENADIVYANGPRVLPAAALAAENLVFHAHSLVPQTAARILV